MLCLCKLSEAHGRLPVPFCVAACGYDYHGWHELFMNRCESSDRGGAHETQTAESLGAQAAQ